MLSDLIKVQDRVYYILDQYPQTRDSDKELWLAYCCLFRGLKEVCKQGSYAAMRHWLINPDTPVFESLSRARRKIQEEHTHLAGAKAQRLEEEQAVREHFR